MITKQQMRNIVRNITARYTQESMTDTQIDIFLNRAYTLHMPLEFKNIKLNKPVVFNTIPNVDTYNFPYENGIATNPDGTPIPGNIQISPPVYCQGYILKYTQDKSEFYNRWPKLTVNQQVGTGNGTAGPYSGSIPQYPFLRAQVDIFGNVVEPCVIFSAQNNTGYNATFTDVPQTNSNTGNLVDSLNNVVGTVNYLSGVFTFTLASGVIPSNTVINVSVIPYQPSRPTDLLFYNQQIVLRPVPYDVYQVEYQVSQQPLPLESDVAIPELDEWYLFICTWAAKLIYTEFPDFAGEADLAPKHEEQKMLAQRRTLRQLGTQRAATLFSAAARPTAGYFFGTQYSGNTS